jgi:hypothetical protein
MEMPDEEHGECLARMVAYIGSLHIAHWKANTMTNEHKTIGELYDKMKELVDGFAEVYMGKYGMVKFPTDAKIIDVGKKPVAAGVAMVEQAQSYFTPGEDDDLLSILSDMSIELNRSKYLLKEGERK